jgi:hypothetical protein
MTLVNTALLREPINWVIVILMLAIAVMGLTLLTPAFGTLGTTAASAF